MAQDQTLINVFLALQLAGTLGFLIITLTAVFSSRVHRHPTWFSFCISWIVWGISFTLLFFAGQQDGTQIESGSRICLVQSALVYAMPHLVGFTSLALILYLLLNVQSAFYSVRFTKRRWLATGLVCVPWMLGTVVFIAFLIYAIRHSADVQLSHNGTFCVIVNSFLPKITSGTATSIAVIIAILEVIIGIILFRHKSDIEGFSQSLMLAFQLLLFTGVVLTAAGIGLVFLITRTRGAIFDIILGAMVLAASIIFGTQRDLLLTWMFWRPPPPLNGASPSIRFGSTLGELSSFGDEVSNEAHTQRRFTFTRG